MKIFILLNLKICFIPMLNYETPNNSETIVIIENCHRKQFHCKKFDLNHFLKRSEFIIASVLYDHDLIIVCTKTFLQFVFSTVTKCFPLYKQLKCN